MKKFFNSLSFILKALLLIVVLLLGWAFINITNLIKGKKPPGKDSLSKDIFGADKATADVPIVGCPFLSCFNGKEFKLENDILFGRPKSYWPTYETAKDMYEDGRISSDLYKITGDIKPHKNKLLFQIQEIEPEESFFKFLRLKRVIHPKNTEIVIDSEFKKYYILPQSDFLKTVVLPSSIKNADKSDMALNFNLDSAFKTSIKENNGIKFQTKDEFYFSFKGLNPKKTSYLILSSWHRDWMLGLEEEWAPSRQFNFYSLINRLGFARAGAVAALLIGSWIAGKWGGIAAAASSPLFMGTQSGGKSIVIDCKGRDGAYSKATVIETRALKYNTEIVEIPKESVNPDGGLELKMKSSKRHFLGFAGISQEVNSLAEENYREEILPLTAAKHSRLGKDISSDLRTREGAYVHTIPGDTIDLEFNVPENLISDGEKETYLIQSSGFYTSLRPENAKLAGNWREKISKEAKERLEKLVSLSSYK